MILLLLLLVSFMQTHPFFARTYPLLPFLSTVAKPMAIATPVAAPKAAQEESGDVLAISVYPFRSDTAGDLTFEKDEKIHIVQKSENQEDWWFGRIGSREGYFPANYVKLL